MHHQRRFLILACLVPILIGLFLFLRNHRLAPDNQSTAENKQIRRLSAAGQNATRPVSTPQHRLAGRVSNSTLSLDQLQRCDHALLLRNAVIDTLRPVALDIPAHLQAKADAGSYLVQACQPLDAEFYALLQRHQATFVSYIPNNAALIHASAPAVAALAKEESIRSVLPYHPYYKLDTSLLPLASENNLPAGQQHLSVTAFPGEKEALLKTINFLGAQLLAEESTPFGPMLVISAPSQAIVPLAQATSVQEIEPLSPRVLLNDRARVHMGIATNTTGTTDNWLRLSGVNVTVSVSDSGVDATHPDLVDRILGLQTDLNGHGTHVAGIIAGNGSQSGTILDAPGSLPGADFRGKAPAATIFSQPIDLTNGVITDFFLQTNAAGRTNILISNNSWAYTNNHYGIAAASYDAATRDAIPTVSGAQPLLFVFAAGDQGLASNDGSGGVKGTVFSPATAKNVITVGATETLRHLSNQVVLPSGITNVLSRDSNDSETEVASFSGRGNVGVGIEGEFGRFKPDVVAPGAFIISTSPSDWVNDPTQPIAPFNNDVGPSYRYESGTSMAAAAVSGMLALIQEYFEQGLNLHPSPALMKALLINGARSLSPNYDFEVHRDAVNGQGWGLANLTNTLPATLSSYTGAHRFLDQNPSGALATAEHHTRTLTIAPEATDAPLRVTLVWTDPPGNPGAGLKLVNDLDLIITNNQTGEVFVGNNFPSNGLFTLANPGTNIAPSDIVNNVENIFIAPPLATNYSITVRARRVNVNAVPDHTNGVVQDYALVVSSDRVDLPAPINLAPRQLTVDNLPKVTTVTNSWPLLGQRVGANAPLLSSTNGLVPQWRFYMFVNSQAATNLSVTNVAFVTFQSRELSVARSTPADIDLYVSTDPRFLSLDPAAVAAANKSLNRGGVEYVLFTNSLPYQAYYIGVKSEDLQGAEFGLVATATDKPFDQRDTNGNILPTLLTPLPAEIPSAPYHATVVALTTDPVPVRRVVLTQAIDHPSISNITASLTHANALGQQCVGIRSLSSAGANGSAVIYDDIAAGDIPAAVPTDGPGSLQNFIGQPANGVWILEANDSASASTGKITNLSIRLEGLPLTTNFSRTIGSSNWFFSYVDLPEDATLLQITATPQGQASPRLFLRHGQLPTLNVFDKHATNSIALSNTDNPPVSGGRWFYGIYNLRATSITATVTVSVQRTGRPNPTQTVVADQPTRLTDSGVTYSQIYVSNNAPILAAQVGVRVSHPRVSDMAISLLSPQGTRVMLFEGRGRTTSNGLFAVFTENTDLTTNLIKFAQPPFGQILPPTAAMTSDFEGLAPSTWTNGQTIEGWQVLTNQVSILSDPAAAKTGSNYLTLANARLTRTIPTVPGLSYTLRYASRGAGIIDWWPGDTNGIDLIGTNHGTPNSIAFNTGEVGNAFSFNGSSSDVQFNNKVGNFGTNEYSIDFWIKTTDTGSRGLLEKRAVCDAYLSMLCLRLNVGGRIGCEVASDGRSGFYGIVTASPINNGAWRHVAFTRKGTNFCTYVDGKLDNTNASMFYNGIPNINSSVTLQMGTSVCVSSPDGTSRFSGQIDELDFFKRALSAAEVKAIYQAQSNGKYSPVSLLPNSKVILGQSTNQLIDNGSLWITNSYTFTAQSNNIGLRLEGNALGMLFDNFQLLEPARTNSLYYLPEESLDAFVGENAAGYWTLEAFDTRTGAAINPELLQWDLQLTFVPPRIDLTILTNGPITNIISPYSIQCFAIDVPTNATFATNLLSSLDGGTLDLLFNQTNPPGGYPEDVLLLSTRASDSKVLSQYGPLPFLLPGQRYYLGVRNPSSTDGIFSLDVKFGSSVLDTNVIALINGVAFSNSVAPYLVPQYYSFDVSPAALSVAFEVLNPSGNVDLALRKGLPLPDRNSFHYLSANPGTNNESIIVLSNSTPVVLSAGRWYLAVCNVDLTNAISYTVRVIETTPTVTELINGVYLLDTVPSGDPISFYSFTITNSSPAVEFLVTNLTGDVDLLVRRGGVPSLSEADRGSFNLSTNAERITIVTNVAWPNLNGTWYLSTPNNTAGMVSFRIRATLSTSGTNFTGVPFRITEQLVSPPAFALKWNSDIRQPYAIDISTNLPTWSLYTNFTSTNSTSQFVDPSATTNAPYRFYRLRKLPWP